MEENKQKVIVEVEEKTIDKLKEPDVLVYIGKCYSSDMGYSAISKAVKKKFDIDASYSQISKVIEIFKSRKSDLIMGDKELQVMVKGAILNTKHELERIHNECLEVLEEAKKIKNFNARLSAIKEIRNQLEFQEKLINRITDLDKPKINKLEMTQVIVNSLEDLEKQGIIKILRHNKTPTIGIDSEYIIDEENIEENEKKSKKKYGKGGILKCVSEQKE